MNKKILFLGPLYPIERESELKENSVTSISNAPNVYQWNLIKGIHKIVHDRLKIINVLPIGTWKSGYKKFFLKDNDWKSVDVQGHEVGSLNLPFIKQLERSLKVKNILKREADENTEVIIYSAYMPFLRAAYILPDSVKVTVIITDLPEYYDLKKVSPIRKLFRNLQNNMIYKYLKRIDRFVVLTKQMCEPLHIGNRPWICIEGICNNECDESTEQRNDIKAILYIGTLHYQYGIKNLLDAFEQIDLDSIELWICGDGEAKKEILSLAQKDTRVKFYGFCTQAEVAALRSKAAILVNPRTNEGEYTKYSFPSKTMEYMASGKPVIMYKLDGIPDEYDEYLNYIRVTGCKSVGLKEAIINVLENYDAALLKANNARKFVLENKSSKAQAERIISFINGGKNE